MIKVLFFAGLAEQAGRAEIEVNFAGTVEELTEWAIDMHKLSPDSLNGAMVAVNEEFASQSTELTAGDVVAFIPPVSGG
ncbi:molybdopterin converting factor subunit 1 [Shouchella clausii]|uniref:molybdopterin converting factor subunit 1 n=1 Tax=Shouchella clausii TaxID=79880 RepID=UPI000B972FEC|nr:molybdopterin converting factor subunit 1 [Shouchella clausii]PAD41658.1 molybdopterin converting factor subunit 1 [Bacillus sp. 7520-S]AST94783.1 molybdopterin converting factor subunit 1 [Shouchella clausii]MCR1289186.1 molybdopterin converting factor subunit 1 [Shouchella clausii]MEB5474749.1 molybdopterin converting factor subunit 1 [Shouchella clausii]PTL21967.1 molybdopterin converting factor subunit 1 [Shouchella clausii]